MSIGRFQCLNTGHLSTTPWQQISKTLTDGCFCLYLKFHSFLSPLCWLRFTFSNFCNCFERLYKVREGLHQKKPFVDVLQNRCLKNFAIFTGKIPVFESLFNKVAGLRVYKFIKKRLQHRFFPVNITKFLRTPFLYNTSVRCFCFKKSLEW